MLWVPFITIKATLSSFLSSIQYYNKVDPVQLDVERSLDIMSTYKVDKKFSIIYAGLVLSSFKSFDSNVWSLVFWPFIVFSILLFLRKQLDPKKKHSLSPIFETFTHLIGQDATDFPDRSGKLISIIMTFGFFFILAFYLNLMSTELVVVTKPHVISNYKDVMSAKNLTVAFFGLTYDAMEFDEAEEGTIQHEFWKQFKDTHMTIGNQNSDEAGEVINQGLKGKFVLIMNTLYAHTFAKVFCKTKVVFTEQNPYLRNKG